MRSERRRVVAAPAIALSVVVALSALTLAASAVPVVSVGGVPAGAAAGANCASLEPAGVLNASIALHYPNASLLPSETVAQRSVNQAWSVVCGSAPFGAGYQASASPQVSVRLVVQDQNRTSGGDLIGSLFASFALGWSAPCPTGAGPYPVGFDCVYSDGWDANLTTMAIAGPAASITSARFVQCDTPAQNQSDVSTVQGYYGYGSVQPSEPVAISEVTAIWGSICTSSAYLDALAQHPNASVSWGSSIGAAVNASAGAGSSGGGIEFEWDISWNAPCPSNVSGYSGDGLCDYTDAWTADLATNTSSGPNLEVFPPDGGAPQYVAPSAGGAAALWWTVPAYQLALAAAAGIVAVAALVIARRGRGGADAAPRAPTSPPMP